MADIIDGINISSIDEINNIFSNKEQCKKLSENIKNLDNELISEVTNYIKDNREISRTVNKIVNDGDNETVKSIKSLSRQEQIDLKKNALKAEQKIKNAESKKGKAFALIILMNGQLDKLTLENDYIQTLDTDKYEIINLENNLKLIYKKVGKRNSKAIKLLKNINVEIEIANGPINICFINNETNMLLDFTKEDFEKMKKNTM